LALTGKYWQKVAAEQKNKSFRIILADKNAPNKDVWQQASLLSN
jgi:hypothetical protein